MSGQWKRRRSLEEWVTLPFAAAPMPPMTKELRPLPEAITGRWRVKFASEETEAVSVINGSDQRLISATFLTTTGDYGFLAGQVTPDHAGGLHAMKASRFDGSHAFLFKAALKEDGTLAGDFWSGASFHDTWTAVKDDAAALPDPFSLAKISGTSAELDALRFPDSAGVERALGEFKGKARIIKLFGTWCPNCKDSVPVLEDLYARYKDKGLSIVGLAFEATGDGPRDRAQVATYVKRFSIEYPVLIAGTRDRAKAQQAFPMLQGVRAYPTFIFVDGEGTVRGVYTGFSGPATGQEHERLKAAFENKVKEMLGGSCCREVGALLFRRERLVQRLALDARLRCGDLLRRHALARRDRRRCGGSPLIARGASGSGGRRRRRPCRTDRADRVARHC
jgi:thiol-disulfide isomerase/thioredoxin